VAKRSSKRSGPREPVTPSRHTIWMLMIVIAIAALIALTSGPAKGQEQQQGGITGFDISDFSGGIDHVLPQNQLPDNQFLSLQNFFLTGNKLKVRDGWGNVTEKLSSLPIEWVQPFRPFSGAHLFIATNKDLWYMDYPNGDTVRISVASISGNATVAAGSRHVSAENADGRWWTYLGSGEGAYIIFTDGDSSATYEVQYITSDSSLHLTADAGSTWTTDSYVLTASDFEVREMISFNEIMWIYTSLGRVDFYGPDSIATTALSGDHYRGSTEETWYSSGVHYNKITVPALDKSYGNEWWLRAVTGCLVDAASEIGAEDDVVYLTYPVNNGTELNNYIACYGGGLLIDFDDDDSLAIFRAAYDSTDQFVTAVDEVVVVQDAGWPTHLEIHCDTCWWVDNDTAFIEGDWFVALAENGVHRTTFPSFPVVNNSADDGDSVIALYCAPEVDTNTYGSEGDTTTVIFYRIKQNSGSYGNNDNYNWATLFDERVFYATADDPTFIYQTQPQFPESLSSAIGFYVSTHDGDQPTAALGQGEVLRVYCENSRHSVTSSDGYIYYVTEMSRGVGVSAPRTLVEYNGIHYYLHRSGVYADDGTPASVAVPISYAINEWFTDSIPAASYPNAVAAVYENRYWICFPLKSGSWKTMVYDIPTSAWTDIDGLTFSAIATDLVADDSLRLLFGRVDSGYVASYRGNFDNSDSITAIIETGYMTMGTPEIDKVYKNIFYSWDNAAPDSINLAVYPDTHSTALHNWTLTSPASFGLQRYNPDLATHGPMVKLKLTMYGAADVRLGFMKVDYVSKSLSN